MAKRKTAPAAAPAHALLAPYRAKRDFRRTAEPSGDAASATGSGPIFVVQKHAARRLHYDFRLELDGVLKSWAVTRGPSLDPAEKRLAVRTEDHPLDYAAFEGTIPRGEYGGGTVMVWDTGQWEPVKDPHEGLARGQIEFRLHGTKLTGEWVLVRLKPRGREKQESWLLIKRNDAAAKPGDADGVLAHETSVVSGRGMDAIAAGAPPVSQTAAAQGERRRAAKPAGAPAALRFIAPQLAQLAERPPEGGAWVHEIKYDGYRLIAACSAGRVRLFTRSGLDWTEKFPGIALALAASAGDGAAVLDGEAVVFDGEGRSRFGALQDALSAGGHGITYVAFDLLGLDGDDLRAKPLAERKTRLKHLLRHAPPDLLRYSDHIEGQGAAFHAEACRLGLEGIISKRADMPYRSGRSALWLKTKCSGRDEFVIAGAMPSDKKGRAFASLILAERVKGRLVYRGHVGTGFSAATMRDLAATLAASAVDASPLADAPKAETRGARWARPELVAEIAYTERTGDGRLRHPSFLGLRADKSAAVVEMPEPVTPPARTGKAAKAARTPPAEKPPAPAPGKRPAKGGVTIAGVTLTHPEKVLFPAQGVTKEALARYLAAVADAMLPFAANRLLSLVRCPEGAGDQCFFQRHLIPGFPAHFRGVPVKEKDGGSKTYLAIDGVEALVGGAQMGVLEWHLWGSPAAAIEHPDRLVMDLDPAPEVPFAEVKRAAADVRALLEAAGLSAWPMVTGGKGIHVVAPLDGSQDWDTVKGFASALARAMEKQEPGRFIAKARKAARTGRIFVDWMRNERGATAICPYSPRAKPGASVAVPVTWAELAKLGAADHFTIATVPARLSRQKRDPWAGAAQARQRIPEGAAAALGG